MRAAFSYRLILQVVIVIGLATLAVAGEDISSRIDKLLHRWTQGDKAARAGVAAETNALGDEAIAELYRRLARNSLDFQGHELGATFSNAPKNPLSGRMVQAEVRFYTPAEDTKIPQRPTLLTAEQLARMIKDAEVISAPSLTVYDGQRANVSVTNQRSYTRTIDPRRRAVKGTVSTGLMLEMRPRLIEGTSGISLEVRCVFAELDGDAVPTLKTPAGEIGMPSVLKREFAVTLTIESGDSVALSLPGEKPLVLTLRTTRIEMDR